ncbi:serine protease nudel-like isoform X2 [Tigriopus californicus]|uniref:serine protease nudel-like isoform X2 n=1 Tax=Tigriopus californicus TaxID=6832 RepID=UPI0027DA861D|nr:serine protease nudel-like isoform X2 [Tigriopus californicus]
MAPHAEEESIAIPQTPLLNGRNPGGGSPSQPIFTRSRLICALTVIFVIVFIIAIILIAVRAGDGGHEEALVQDSKHTNLESASIPCVNNTHLQAAQQRQEDLQFTPEQLVRLKQLLEFLNDPEATNQMIEETRNDAEDEKLHGEDHDDKDHDKDYRDEDDDDERIKQKALELLKDPEMLKQTLKDMDPKSREELKATLNTIREQSWSSTPKPRDFDENTPNVLESRQNPWDDEFFSNNDDDFESINQMLESHDMDQEETTPVPKAQTWEWNLATKKTTTPQTVTTEEPTRSKTRRAADMFRVLFGLQMPNTEDRSVPADYLENSWKDPSESEVGKVTYENMLTLSDIESASDMEDTDLQGIYERSGKSSMTAGMARSVGECQDNEIQCDNGVGCYIEEERCDRIMHCLDHSDELGCTCRQYISSEKLCDNFLDCKNGEDEEDCGCPKGQFNCGLETKCIFNDQVCNNVIDCENGLDESNCAALAPLSKGLLNPNVTGSPFIDGLVYWKVDQQFHPLCVDFPEPGQELEYFKIMAEDVCDSLLPGMMDGPPEVKLIQNLDDMKHIENVVHLEFKSLEKLPGHKFLGGTYQFTLMPPDEKSTMAEITCPTPKCGVRASVKPSEGAIPLMIEPTAPTTTLEAGLINDKIVGGTDADAKNWPAIVAIYRDGDFICGGTIINDEWVLTAAHCVENYKENQYYFDILVGMLRKNSKSSLQYSRKVVKVVINEEFDSTYLKNDVAMLKVDKPFIFNAFAGQACLPTSPEMSPQVGDICYAAGWGNKREDRDPAEHLQEVRIPIMESCKKDYNNIELQICGGRFEGGIDSCQGDSGGPLFCQKPDDPNRWYLGGVISHGEGCARSDTPGVYTRVYAYTQWIEDKLAEDASRDPGTGVEFEPRLECPTHVCDGKCRKKYELCNKYVDCFDQTDELWCAKNNEDQIVFSPPSNEPQEPDSSPFIERMRPLSTNLAYYPIIKRPTKTCKFGYFRCNTVHQCIPQEKTCDRVPDCVDYSDERTCTCLAFLSRKAKHRACDGYPDCKKWEDERNCKFCDPDHFFCDLSRECIPRHKVCDTKADCKFKEDERYCFTLINTNSVWLQQDGRPKKQTTGILAFSSKGLWAASCVQTWTDVLSNQICRYMGYKFAVTHTQHSSDTLPHLKGQVLTIRYQDGQKSVFPRSFDSYLEEKQALTDEVRVEKRQAKACSFVHLECSETTACGIMPLYDRLGKQAPLAGPGVFPWQVTLYKQGQYFCGGSLVHQYWVLTSTECADMTNIKGGDYIIARAGGHREQFSLSAHDQLRRVVQFTTIPGTNISMAFLSTPFTLTEHVSTVCIPSVTWTPINRTCFITGRYNGVLNHVYQTTVDLVCHYVPNKQYSFCTRQRNPTNECLEQWSGALVCPDNSGTYYAVGGYFSGQANCKFGSEKAPDRFETLVSKHAREGITSVIKSAEADKHPFKNIPDNCDTLRCPLGRCLSPNEICDGVVHCSNMADEEENLCRNKIRMCEFVNQTHCACPQQDFQCGNGMCLDKTKFCNGLNECGDDSASDEPENCHSCPVALKTLNPKAICNGNVECVGKNDIGEDESAATCCPDLPGGIGSNSSSVNATDAYRCVIGELSAGASYNSISISDECIPSLGVCDWDTNPNVTRCSNGADELDCIAIWPQFHVKEHPKDPFGRFISSPKGYLYFVAFGKKFLYCAGLQSFKPALINSFADVLCKSKGFRGAISVTLSEPQSRARLGPEIPMTGVEQAHFEACQLVYLTCRQYY